MKLITAALYLATVSSAAASSPSKSPSKSPSHRPSSEPSQSPSDQPSGQPSESPSDVPSSEPSETPSCTPFQAPTPQASVNLLYRVPQRRRPASVDGRKPLPLALHHVRQMLQATLQLEQHDDTCERALWYPDWDGNNKGCVRDGNEPYYMTQNPSNFIFITKADCCAEHYSWNSAECMGGSTALASGTKWYADWVSGAETCKNDGKAPQYMVDNEAAWCMVVY